MKRVTDREETGRVVARRIPRESGPTIEEAGAGVSSVLGCVREIARVPENVLRGIALPTR